MCRLESGICVFFNGDLTVYTSESSSSHAYIREEFNITNDGSYLGRFQTPVECFPTTDIYKDWVFVFDDTKPDWWEDWMTEKAKRELYKSGLKKIKHFEGDLFLTSLTSISKSVTLSPGGDLYLNSLTSIPENVTLSPGGNLFLDSLTSIPKSVTLSPGRCLFLNRKCE